LATCKPDDLFYRLKLDTRGTLGAALILAAHTITYTIANALLHLALPCSRSIQTWEHIATALSDHPFVSELLEASISHRMELIPALLDVGFGLALLALAACKTMAAMSPGAD